MDRNGAATAIHYVIYDQQEQKDLIRYRIEQSLNIADLSDERSTTEAAIACAVVLRRLAAVFKNPKFSEEKEWRIIHAPRISKDALDHYYIDKSISQIRFRSGENKIIPYFHLEFSEKRDEQAILELIVGPRNMSSQKHVEMLLYAHSFTNVLIKRSDASYRG